MADQAKQSVDAMRRAKVMQSNAKFHRISLQKEKKNHTMYLKQC
jgi:hypothetical protein